jgi:hypothetical protein
MGWRVGVLLGVTALAPLSPALADELGDRIRINGYANFEFEKQLGDDGFGDKNGSFDDDQLDLVFNVQATDRIRVAMDLSWEHGTATEDDRGNQALEYGFVEYTFSDAFKVRAGKMLTPFGIFNEIHTAKPAFITVKEASSLNKTERIVKDAFHYYPRWGAGIGFHGDVALGGNDNLTYDVLVANGEQDHTNPFEEDDNAVKSVTARVRFEPSEKFRCGNSFYFDKDDTSFGRIWSDGVELEAQWKGLRIWSEAALGHLKNPQGLTTKQVSFYIQPSWHFEKGVSPYLRLERVDPNTEIADDQGWDFIAGINWEAAKNFMLKAENNHFHGGAASSLGSLPGHGYNEIKASVSLGF